jgi:predicted  nucleic acid-binding Zn-ribbon protein
MSIPKDALVEALLALQAFEGLNDPPQTSASYEQQLRRLRAPIPVSVLVHHEYRRRRKKRSITPARNGVCGHCHIAVPKALVIQMSRTGALGSCPHCEGFLYIESEPAAAAERKKPATAKSKSSRKADRKA